MIRDHEFNCAWWGGRVGILDDPAFFLAPESVRRGELAPYEWVEFRCGLADVAEPRRISDAGFAQVDTQLRFRIALDRLSSAGRPTDDLSVRFADSESLALPRAEWPNFPHERFRHLPGVNSEKLSQRYAIWGSQLLARSPQWCVEVGVAGDPQGWFLAEPEGEHLDLALAMLRRGATLSGLDFYHAALAAFARRGARLGEARFSIENRAVLNIYARLGAVFLKPIGYWIWSAR